MIFNIQLVVFIVLNFKSNNVEGGCSGASICNWIRWEPWSDCSVTCGGGTRRRYRHYCCKSSLASDTNACMKDCHHDMSYYYRYNSESQSCNTFCYNGYYWNNVCRCSDTFYGSCCGNPCPKIDNCKRRRCTYSWNTKCLECYDDKIFFNKTSGDTKCERLCSWNNHYCWPGKCGEDLTRECTCAQDFKIVQKSGETSCQPKKLPSILTCGTVVVGPNMEKKQARSSTNSRECQYLADMYVNFQPSSFKFDVAAEYTVNISAFTNPDFISESKFGITDFSIDIDKILVDGRRSIESRINRLVDNSSSVNCSQTYFDSDNITVTSSSFDFHDGQALCLQFRVDAGGYLKSKNIITHTISLAVPYQKVRKTRELCYRYDISPAKHCKENGNCSYEPIQFESRVTRYTDINVDFIGWFDPVPTGGKSVQASSIESYQITVNEVTVSTRNIEVNYLSNVYTKKVDFKEKRIPLKLASEKPRLYCVTLEVKDVADNVKQARRFILYDNLSFIETRDDKPFYVTSASKQTNYKWQTHHHDICLSWKDHFLNRFYFDNPLLNPIAPEPHGLVSGIYDQNDGILPVSGTPNVHGIVQTLVSWILNDRSPSAEINVPNFQNQSFCKDLNVKDGQTYTIFIRSIDIANNTFIKNRTVHIDQSVPHINNIWFFKDLSEMQLHFKAFDPHSGVRQIEWTFGNSITELNSGSLSVGSLKENSCPQSAENCYCPDVGQYDPSVDVGKDPSDRSDFKTATVILGIISVICIGTSAGIVIWFKRKTKGTDKKACNKSSHRSQNESFNNESYGTEMQEYTGRVYENLPQQYADLNAFSRDDMTTYDVLDNSR